MAEPGRLTLRQTFDHDAERYDRAWPGYPEAVLDDLVALARLSPGSQVLEIGCGTATSFHLLDPDVRAVKAAATLRTGGALAVISTHHVAGGTAPFFDAVEACYERWMPGTLVGSRLPAADDVPSVAAELTADGLF